MSIALFGATVSANAFVQISRCAIFCGALQGWLVAALELLPAAYFRGRMYRYTVRTRLPAC
jgi:hypothetical protein